jgi:small conductance mechanosensitive channel
MMSSPLTHWSDFSLLTALHVALILALALACNRWLRRATNKMVKPAASQARAAQQREAQTRSLGDLAYGAGSKIIWLIAALTALPEFGVSWAPATAVLSIALLGIVIGGVNTVRDVIAGFQILMEDQYAAGDTIQAGDVTGRVEQLSLRRTLLRDARGALVTLANAEMRAVSNLSRDWSQAFVDISVATRVPLGKTLQALEAAAAELRGDAAWAQALVDGPRVLGVQDYDDAASTLRLQLRTAPTRQDEVCRELRRRIQIEFQRQGISLSHEGPPDGANAQLT